MERKLVLNMGWLIAAVWLTGCASPIVIRGDVPFKSEPISKVYVDLNWTNSTGRPLDLQTQEQLDRQLSYAGLCEYADSDLFVASLRGMWSVQNARGETRSLAPQDLPLWIEKKFGMPANCCRRREMADVTYPDKSIRREEVEIRYLCEKDKFVNNETMVLKFSARGSMIGLDVLHGIARSKIGSIECGDTRCGVKDLVKKVVAEFKKP